MEVAVREGEREFIVLPEAKGGSPDLQSPGCTLSPSRPKTPTSPTTL
jgi:hypothetical protein